MISGQVAFRFGWLRLIWVFTILGTYTFGPNTEEPAYISSTSISNKLSTINNSFGIIDKFNSVWHDDGKHGKYSSLESLQATTFIRLNELSRVSNYPIGIFFHLQKCLEIFLRKFRWQNLIQQGQGDKNVPPPLAK